MSGYAQLAEMAMQNPALMQAGMQAMGMGGAGGMPGGVNPAAMQGMGGTGGMGGAGGMGGMGGKAGMMNAFLQNQQNGMSMADSASQVAMATGNPEVAIGIEAAKWYGKWNGIYTIVIIIILCLLLWWIFLGMLCGSYISMENGWEMSAGWSGS